MANVGPMQAFQNVANLQTIPDITRFLTSFCQQVHTQFNNLISNRTVAGTVSGTGTVVGGTYFSASMVTTSSFFVKFLNPFVSLPSVVGTPINSAVAVKTSGVTMTSFTFTTSTNVAFSFIAIGGR